MICSWIYRSQFGHLLCSILVFLSTFCLALDHPSLCSEFVTFLPQGELGNILFEVATTHAVAWTNGATAYVPDTIPLAIRQHMLHRCAIKTCSDEHVRFTWKEPSFAFTPITFFPNMQLIGYFQSERYFVHYRDRLLKLFAPSQEDLTYIEKKYSSIIHHPNTVGVQLRYYKWYDPHAHMYPQYGTTYLQKAMSQFTEDSLFVVSSNNIEFAKKSIPPSTKNVVFLENEPNYIDLFILSLCKHNIISNSSFGWWAAWLNTNPNKKVFYPATLFYTLPCQDYGPTNWIPIDALPEK